MRRLAAEFLFDVLRCRVSSGLAVGGLTALTRAEALFRSVGSERRLARFANRFKYRNVFSEG